MAEHLFTPKNRELVLSDIINQNSEFMRKIKCDYHYVDNLVARYEEEGGYAIQLNEGSLASGDWCIVTSPKRRHKERNFASLISARLGSLLGIPFYEDIAECHSKHRVGAVFTFGKEPPKENGAAPILTQPPV